MFVENVSADDHSVHSNVDKIMHHKSRSERHNRSRFQSSATMNGNNFNASCHSSPADDIVSYSAKACYANTSKELSVPKKP
eukprot:3030431-Amphidinium_carterae.1